MVDRQTPHHRMKKAPTSDAMMTGWRAPALSWGVALSDGSYSVIGAFYEVYTVLGFGFLESVYKLALEVELKARGHEVQRELAARVWYKGIDLTSQRLDMVVDGRVIVEVKSTFDLHPTAKRQVYNYLRATNLDVGLILHFGPKPKVHRITTVG